MEHNSGSVFSISTDEPKDYVLTGVLRFPNAKNHDNERETGVWPAI